jgi:WD40 repeat protein
MKQQTSNQTARNPRNRNLPAGCLAGLVLLCLILGLGLCLSPVGRYFIALFESQAELSREISALPTYKSLPVASISPQNLNQVVEVKRLSTNNSTGFFVWSPDSRMLAMGYARGVDYWNISEGRRVGSIVLESSPQGIAFSLDGKILAVSRGVDYVLARDNKGWTPVGNDELAIYDVASGSRIRTFSRKVGNLAISPDGTRLAAGMQGGKAILLDISSGQELRMFTAPRVVGRDQKTLPAFSPDGKILALGYVSSVLTVEAQSVTVWNVETGTLVSSHSANVGGEFGFMSNGKQILTNLGILDITTGNLQSWVYRIGGLCSAIAPDGSVGAFVKMPLPDFSVDQPPLTLHSLQVDKPARELGRASVCPISFSPDGRLLASGSGQVRLWGVSP